MANQAQKKYRRLRTHIGAWDPMQGIANVRCHRRKVALMVEIHLRLERSDDNTEVNGVVSLAHHSTHSLSFNGWLELLGHLERFAAMPQTALGLDAGKIHQTLRSAATWDS